MSRIDRNALSLPMREPVFDETLQLGIVARDLDPRERARRRKAVSDRPDPGARDGCQSISAKKIVTPPVAKFGMSLTAACPSSDPKPACSAFMSSNVSSAMRW
jgi:hypothetical protein